MSIGLAAGVKDVSTHKVGAESSCASDLECSRLKTTTAPALVESHDAARDKAEQELAGAVNVLAASEHCRPGPNPGNPTQSHTLLSSVFDMGGGEFRRLLIFSKAHEGSAAGLVRFPLNQLNSDDRWCSTIESRGECCQSPNMRIVVGARARDDWWLWVALSFPHLRLLCACCKQCRVCHFAPSEFAKLAVTRSYTGFLYYTMGWKNEESIPAE